MSWRFEKRHAGRESAGTAPNSAFTERDMVILMNDMQRQGQDGCFPRPDPRPYLGKTVTIGIDRPIGYTHEKNGHCFTYPINYGYISGVLGGDGEELDVYLLGVHTPVDSYTGRIVGIVFRTDDVEDKLVMAPEGVTYTAEEIREAVFFQERYHRSYIEVLA